ncbi:MAG: hypothetical protein E6Q76_05625 [Rhizobium sp.]|nr:MAG: hypothetical protein E6Q76_05625 [Rhizobium sp.]
MTILTRCVAICFAAASLPALAADAVFDSAELGHLDKSVLQIAVTTSVANPGWADEIRRLVVGNAADNNLDLTLTRGPTLSLSITGESLTAECEFTGQLRMKSAGLSGALIYFQELTSSLPCAGYGDLRGAEAHRLVIDLASKLWGGFMRAVLDSRSETQDNGQSGGTMLSRYLGKPDGGLAAPGASNKPAASFQPADRKTPKVDPSVEFDTVFAHEGAVLRENASIVSRQLKILRKGERLALVDRPSTDAPFYHVIYVPTAEEGFVDRASGEVVLSRENNVVMQFAEIADPKVGSPQIEVTNNTERVLNLTLGQRREKIMPHQTAKAAAMDGEIGFVLWAPGVLPAVGRQHFAGGHRYVLTYSLNQ